MSLILQKSAESGFPTTLGAWGELLAGAYDAAREELPGEKSFWASLVEPHMRVLEIGAGGGFLSIPLALRNPESLFLVEPEQENVRLLKMRLQVLQGVRDPIVVPSKFETSSYDKLDLIVFPYDSLPMITDAHSRAKIFNIAAQRLRANGLFVVHISTPSFVASQFAKAGIVEERSFRTALGVPIQVRRTIKIVSPYEYIKFFSIQSQFDGRTENYLAMTSVVTESELLQAARWAGLTLVDRYSDFDRTPFKRQCVTDDDIFVFRKYVS